MCLFTFQKSKEKKVVCDRNQDYNPPAASLTLLYGLCDFLCVLGEVKVCHVGLQVAYRTFPSCHTESLYGQI